jgi:galactose mutarotase-like enzyme
MTAPTPSEPFRKTLLSAERRLQLEEWSVSNRDLEIPEAEPLSISSRTLHGGRQEGVDLITINNGRIAITVIPTRGMGILNVQSRDVRLEWNSPVKQVVHPQFITLEGRGGLGWLEGFNEWLARCGLEFAGGPGKDTFITNTGDQAEMDLTLHGKIANIPASEIEVVVDRHPPYRIRLRGRVDEFMFFGPKLELWTEISTEPNSPSFRVEDTVTNRGGADQEFELIYHVNFGAPLLEESSRFVAPLRQVTPINARAARAVAQYETFAGPTQGFVEEVFCLWPRADQDGRATIMLRNAAGDQAASMAYDLQSLPCLTLWKNTNSLEEGYVTGLEPGTNFPYNRRIERKAGRLQKLAPGQTRSFIIDHTIHSGEDDVRRVADRIAAIQGGQPIQIDSAPPKVD